jgi:hypothetical protein
MNKRILFAAIYCFLLLQTNAQTTQPTVGLPTKTVSVFKNNKAFFIKSGTVMAKDSVYQLEGQIPAALFGTLWFQSPNNGIRWVRSSEENVGKMGTPENHYEILKANINKTVFVYLNWNDNIDGVIQSFSREYDEENKTHFPANFVTLKAKDRWHTIKIADIRRISFAENPVSTVKSYEKKKVLNVHFNNGKAAQPLNLMYLENGLNWSPNYLLELTSESKGILTLNAQVKNDAEDIKGADVSFVVGNANFGGADRLAWLVDFLTDEQRDVNSWGGGGFAFEAKSIVEDDKAKAPSQDGDGVEGESTEDLFFYNLKNLDIAKGSRMQLELFRAEISFEHIYQVSLNGLDHYSMENYLQPSIFSEDKTPKTWHSLKLENKTKYPWTAGLCFVVNKEKEVSKPISQDLLTYTPMKGDNFLKITESPDIKVEHSEKEIARKTKVRKNGDIYYDEVTVEAEIKVKNYKTNEAKMSVKRMVLGTLLKSSVDWKYTERLNYSGYINKANDVIWETPVKAVEEKIIKYTYTIIVRAN